MMISISKQFYESLDEKELSYECIKPAIFQIRGEDQLAKTTVYSQLNESQKAVFSFHVYYQHAGNSAYEFLFSTKDYIESGFLEEIKKGVQYFENNELLSFLRLIEELGDVSLNDETAVNELYYQFIDLSGKHLLIMAKDIRRSAAKYIQIEE
jgi:hypothetical protein